MKSFDEVIKALSICGRHPNCEGCPYENVSYPTEIGNTCKDIMHYDALYYMQDRIDECQEANPPLTWDELRTMEGKPVWVEVLSDEIDLSSRWMLVARETKAHSLPLAYTDDIGHWIFGHEDKLGKIWQAYRKERFNTEYEDIPMEYFENGGI